jgi:hypothetical protein
MLDESGENEEVRRWMAMAKVGVEQSLSDVQDALKERGYDIVQLKQENDAKGCDCCVITGQDRDVMGIQNTVTAGSVIQASGLSAEEVCREVEHRLNR